MPFENQETLSIEERGDEFALVRVAPDGRRAELALTEANIMFLPRLVPRFLRELLARRYPGGSRPAPPPAFPVQGIYVNTDQRSTEIVMTVYDRFGGEGYFTLDGNLARDLAHRLLARADEVKRTHERAAGGRDRS